MSTCRRGIADVLCGDRTPVPLVSRAIRASLYGATVFLSFFLMLVFMTYNVRANGFSVVDGRTYAGDRHT